MGEAPRFWDRPPTEDLASGQFLGGAGGAGGAGGVLFFLQRTAIFSLCLRVASTESHREAAPVSAQRIWHPDPRFWGKEREFGLSTARGCGFLVRMASEELGNKLAAVEAKLDLLIVSIGTQAANVADMRDRIGDLERHRAFLLGAFASGSAVGGLIMAIFNTLR